MCVLLFFPLCYAMTNYNWTCLENRPTSWGRLSSPPLWWSSSSSTTSSLSSSLWSISSGAHKDADRNLQYCIYICSYSFVIIQLFSDDRQCKGFKGTLWREKYARFRPKQWSENCFIFILLIHYLYQEKSDFRCLVRINHVDCMYMLVDRQTGVVPAL